MQFLFVRTNHAVWLTSVLTSRLATPVSSTGQALPLALLQDVTPVHRGLPPFGLFKSMNYIYHSRHTQRIKIIGRFWLNSKLVFILAKSPFFILVFNKSKLSKLKKGLVAQPNIKSILSALLFLYITVAIKLKKTL